MLPELVKKDWIKWMLRYRDLIKVYKNYYNSRMIHWQSDVGYSLEERKKVMCAANPKYILRYFISRI